MERCGGGMYLGYCDGVIEVAAYYDYIVICTGTRIDTAMASEVGKIENCR